MLVVIVGVTTVAVALASDTVKVSGPSTTASCVVAMVKVNRRTRGEVGAGVVGRRHRDHAGRAVSADVR